jgi:hypothetical protein
MDMAKATMGFGVGLFVLGLVGYVGSGAESVTALIPSVFGIVLGALGWAAQASGRRKLLLHIAVALGVIGILGSAPGLAELPALVRGDEVERPWAVAVQSIMTVTLAAYVALGVRSFMAARQVQPARR